MMQTVLILIAVGLVGGWVLAEIKQAQRAVDVLTAMLKAQHESDRQFYELMGQRLGDLEKRLRAVER